MSDQDETSADTNTDANAATSTGPRLERLRIERGPTGRRRRGIGRWIVLGVIVIAIGALSIGPLKRLLAARPVRTAPIVRVAATQGAVRTTASGYVVARRRAAISSRLSGRLESLLVDVGDAVEAGQLLGTLGAEDLEAAVTEAEATVATRRAELTVLEKQFEAASAAVETARRRRSQSEATVATAETELVEAKRLVTVEERLLRERVSMGDTLEAARSARDVRERLLFVARARAETARVEVVQHETELAVIRARDTVAQRMVEGAEAGRARAAALYRDASVRAPFAGIVLRKEAEVGEMVAPVNAAGSMTRGAIVTLADFASLEMEVDVIERDIGRVSEGLPCRIVLDSRTEPYQGRVRQVVPTADRTRGTVQVKITFDQLDEHVLPEMSGRVEFLDEDAAERALGADRVLAPDGAITQRDGANGVFVVTERVVRFHAVGRGDEDADGRVEIHSELRGGEDVVLSPPDDLADGGTVRILADEKAD